MIQIFNEDCLTSMREHMGEGTVDIVITSPPYNNSRTSHTEKAISQHTCRYAEYDDNKTNEEYCEWIAEIFRGYDKIVKKNGVVLFNVSYGSENPTVMFEMIHEVNTKTNWMISDIICWKKKSALPNNVSTNKLTRIWEPVFVFCRKKEYETYFANKEVTSVSNAGQNFYSSLYNFISAPNNDGANDLNKATFSASLVEQLLDMYATSEDVTVYDSFMGTGTTAVACKRRGMNCFGSEISKAQCEYAEERLKHERKALW